MWEYDPAGGPNDHTIKVTSGAQVQMMLEAARTIPDLIEVGAETVLLDKLIAAGLTAAATIPLNVRFLPVKLDLTEHPTIWDFLMDPLTYKGGTMAPTRPQDVPIPYTPTSSASAGGELHSTRRLIMRGRNVYSYDSNVSVALPADMRDVANWLVARFATGPLESWAIVGGQSTAVLKVSTNNFYQIGNCTTAEILPGPDGEAWARCTVAPGPEGWCELLVTCLDPARAGDCATIAGAARQLFGAPGATSSPAPRSPAAGRLVQRIPVHSRYGTSYVEYVDPLEGATSSPAPRSPAAGRLVQRIPVHSRYGTSYVEYVDPLEGATSSPAAGGPAGEAAERPALEDYFNEHRTLNILQYWRDGYTAADIGPLVNLSSGRVRNIVTDKRKELIDRAGRDIALQLIPYHRG